MKLITQQVSNNRNIQYWIDYWDSLFSGIEHHRFSLSLISPRVLLRELIEEVETRSLKNAENKRFFCDQINMYFSNDPPTKKCLLTEIALLRREFEKPRLEIVVQLCRRGLAVMDSLQYFDSAVEALVEVLLASTPVNRKTVGMLCQDIIVELLEIGFSLKFIESIPENLFSGIIEREERTITNFPHGIAYPTDGDVEKETAYHTELKAIVTSLTEKDRLLALKKYPRQSRRELRFIFQVRGLRGSGGFDVGPIHFYMPTEERFVIIPQLVTEKIDNPELFDTTENIYLNAISKVNTIELHSGASLARRHLIEALNLLRFTLGSQAQFEVGNDYLVIQNDGHIAGSSHSRDRRSGILQWHESLEITDEVLTAIKRHDILQEVAPELLSKTERIPIERKLMDSLHWYRKGKEAEAPEDQLLWFWIAIENLLNPFAATTNSRPLLRFDGHESAVSIALDILPRLRCLANTYGRGWGLFNELNSILSSPLPFGRFSLPEEVLKRAGLKQYGQKVFLRNFIETIPDIKIHMPDDVLREHLQEAYEFYNDSAHALAVIEAERKVFHDDVVMLYRTRNKIVHSASVGDTTLPYYIRSASEFARELIRNSLGQFYLQKNRSLDGILAALFAEFDLLLENIRKDGPALTLFKQD